MHQLAKLLPHRSTSPGPLLLGSWFAGLSLGLWAAPFRGDAYASSLAAAVSAELSVAGSVVVAVLPLLLSACAVILFERRGAYGFCLLRGLSLGFSLGTAAMLCGSGGGLLAALLLFSGLCSGPVLLWYLLRRLRLGMVSFAADTAVSMGILCLIGAADASVIAPFLALAVTF